MKRVPTYGVYAAKPLIAGERRAAAGGGYALLGTAVLVSAALHASFFVCLPKQPTQPPTPQPITMQVVTSPPKAPVVPPPPAAITPTAAPPITARHVAPRPPPRPASSRPAATAQAPHASRTTPAAAAPVHIGLSLSSTTVGGSVTMPTGDGLDGQPSAAALGKPQQSNAPATLRPSYQLTTAPEVDAEPDLRNFYPEAERKESKEGQVVLMLTLDNTGRVTKATVQTSAGLAFDAAACRAALEKLHFKPGMLDGQAVATQIQYKITFLLD